MKGIFIHDTRETPFAWAIAHGDKTIETRSRNMLAACVGETVAIIRTRSGHKPDIVGFVDITRAEFCPASEFDKYRDQTLIPEGSRFDCHGKGKWFYHLENAQAFFSQPLPENVTRHGRSWCEW